MWPFGKENQPEEPAAGAETVTTDSTAPVSEEATATVHDDASEAVAENVPANGPFNINNVSPTQFDFSDFAKASLNLGSMLLPIPHAGDIQVETGPTGPAMLYVATEHGHVTPIAFAAPTSGGLWEESAQEIKDGLESDGFDIHVERGPWGSEVVGHASDMEIRIIDADGPRWVLHMTASDPADRVEELADLIRGLLTRSFVSRSENPMPVGQPLPITLPPQMVERIRRIYQQQTQAAQAEDEPGQVPGATGINPDGSTNQFGQPANIENLTA